MTEILREWVDPECPYPAGRSWDVWNRSFRKGVEAAHAANPAIVLPERSEGGAWGSGWNSCLDEIRRLNERDPKVRRYMVTVPEWVAPPPTWVLPDQATVVEVTE